MRIPNRCYWLAVGLVIFACMPSGSASAQIPGAGSLPQQRRLLLDQLRPLILLPELRTPVQEEPFQYDYGAVLRYTGLWFEDQGPQFLGTTQARKFQGSRSVHQWDFRPWASASYDGVHHGFVRGQLDFLQYNSGDSFRRNSDWDGPFVDVGYYRLDVDEAMRRYHDRVVDSWAADLVVGRQFLFVGRGIAFSLTADAVSLDWGWRDWGGLLFAGQSIRHFDNIDLSIPGFTRSDRAFFSAQLEYQRLDHHQPYGFVVVQRDHSDESPEDPDQEFEYDSEYWGIGITGEALFGSPPCAVGVPNLMYFAEAMLQRGNSFGDGATEHRDSIRGWAIDAGLDYFWQAPMKPRFHLEYARASGDPDRRMPQNTIAGNQPGTTDEGFLSFGFLNTGVSFLPLFANLEFVRAGAAFRPFDESHNQRLRELEIGTSGFAYWRPSAQGGVSDVRADIPGDRYLGSEWDLFVNWRLSSDLYMILNYGIFWPHEDSFSVDESRQFLSWNFTWLL